MQVWCNAAEALGASPKCYADDASAKCGAPGQVLELLDMTELFDKLTGMKINMGRGKSLAWALRNKKNPTKDPQAQVSEKTRAKPHKFHWRQAPGSTDAARGQKPWQTEPPAPLRGC